MKRSNLVKLLTAIAAICLMLTVFTACDLGLDKVNLSLRVKFVVDDEIVYKVTTTKGSTIDLPESPRKDEWVFDGWYLDDGTFEKPFDGKVSADGMVSVMVYAKWKACAHNVARVVAKAATCLEIGWNAYEYCSDCGYTTYEEIGALCHIIKQGAKQEANETNLIGWDAYEYCEREGCGYTTKQEHPWHEHKDEITLVEAQAPTCLDYGWNAYYSCSHEGCDFTATQLEIHKLEAIAHKNKEHHEKVDATCTETGTIEYWACPDCKKNYSDEACTKVVTDLTSKALDHDYDSKITTQPTCTEKGVRTYTCKRTGCGDSYTEDVAIDPNAHDMKPVAKKDATCTETGYAAYEKCSRCDHNTKGADLPALNHDYDSKITTQPTCKEKGVRTYTCKRTGCGDSYTEDVAIDPNAHDMKPVAKKDVTCTETGYAAYEKCSRCDHNTKGADIPALNHDYDSKITTQPTCTEKGVRTYTCKRTGCGDSYTEDIAIDPNAHDIENHVAKAATCTEDGWDAYDTCKREGCKYTTYKKVDALGHDNKGSVEHKDATCTEDGVEGGTYCTRCNDGKAAAEKTIKALGHDNKGSVAHKDPTCTETGVEGGTYCSRCNDGKTAAEATINARGHVNKKHVDEKGATFTTGGNVKHWHCSDCGVNFSDEDCTTAISDVTIKAMGEQYLFDYVDGIRVQAESTLYSGAIIQNAASGKILGGLSASTIIKFGIQSDVEREVELFVNSVIRVDSANSGKASDRFTLKVNGVDVDLSSKTITGVTYGSNGWWAQPYSGTSLGKITLSSGENIIEITTSSEMNIDYFYFTYPEFDYTEWLKIEAENTLFSGLVVRNDGSGKILGVNDSASSRELKFVVYSDVEKEVELFINSVIRVDSSHSSKASDRFTLKVGGNAIDLSNVTLTGKGSGWYNEPYRSTSLGKITLSKGPNFVEFSVSSLKEVNIDYFYFDYPPFEYADGMKVEAEDTLFNGLTIRNGGSGKILGYNSNSEMKFVVHSSAEREVELFIGALICTSGNYSKVASDRFTLTVNGASMDLSKIEIAGVPHVSGTANWWDQKYNLNSLGKITLSKGANLIKVTSSAEMNIDCFYFNYPVFTYGEAGLTVQAESSIHSNAAVQTKNDRTNLGSLSKSSTVKFAVYSDSVREIEFFVNSQIRTGGKYSTTGSDRFTLKVNGVAVDLSSIVLTGVSHDNGGWYTKDYSDASLGKITLAAGVNAIEMTFSDEMNVDYFTFRVSNS